MLQVEYGGGSSGGPRQMMVVQPQMGGRTSPMKQMSSDAILIHNRPVPTPRCVCSVSVSV